MLRYIGHPLIDVGTATITAYSRRLRPQDVTVDDLTAFANFLKDIYSHLKSVQNFISVVFQGPAFTQPAKTVEDKLEYADAILYSFLDDAPTIENVNCVFFPEKLAVIYAFRQHFPLLNGREISNFSGLGRPGIPVSGLALLAIHAMPLGCYKCGNLLAFHQLSDVIQVDAGKMNLILARRALEANLKAISMMSSDSAEGNMPSFGSYAKTRYVDMILRAKQESQSRSTNIDNITGYYFTNYGPKPNLEIIRLDNAVLGFVDAAQQDLSDAWRRVVYSGWKRPKGEEESQPDEHNTEAWRNTVYERLFNLPNEARQFIHSLANGNDWRLIEIFLERVLNMERERIEIYRELGDRLAQYILQYENGSPGFYYEFRRARDYSRLRNRLFSAAERLKKAETPEPLFTYEQYVMAFEHPSDTYSQWRLARDLIAIRMLEILHKHQVDMSDMPDILEEETEE